MEIEVEELDSLTKKKISLDSNRDMNLEEDPLMLVELGSGPKISTVYPKKSKFPLGKGVRLVGGLEFESGDNSEFLISYFFYRQSPHKVLGTPGLLFLSQGEDISDVLTAIEAEGCRYTLLGAVFVDLNYNKVKLPADVVLRTVIIQLQVSC